MTSRKTIIIGGGLAGLITALQLSGQGLEVVVVEKKSYPFHKVCGEYISNEVLPYFSTLGIDIASLEPARITHFLLSSPKGQTLKTSMDLGGFGISRFRLDHYLYGLAKQRGVEFRQPVNATNVSFKDDAFTVTLSDGREISGAVVIGAYGKRSNLDRKLNRAFFEERSPYLAVKYHLRTQLPKHQISLHNFKDGYAGISAVEDDRYCFCYLTTRKNLKTYGTIPEMEHQVLRQNPLLKEILTYSEPLYTHPEVINEISFAPKSCVEDHVLMAGDAAGLITPLCGNGMAMAVHAAKLVSEQVSLFLDGLQSRKQLEENYTSQWQQQFGFRLKTGRLVQKLFGHPVLSEVAVAGLRHMPGAVQAIMRRTHGQPF